MSLGLIPGLAGTLPTISGPTLPQMEANLAMTPASKWLASQQVTETPCLLYEQCFGYQHSAR